MFEVFITWFDHYDICCLHDKHRPLFMVLQNSFIHNAMRNIERLLYHRQLNWLDNSVVILPTHWQFVKVLHPDKSCLLLS